MMDKKQAVLKDIEKPLPALDKFIDGWCYELMKAEKCLNSCPLICEGYCTAMTFAAQLEKAEKKLREEVAEND